MPQCIPYAREQYETYHGASTFPIPSRPDGTPETWMEDCPSDNWYTSPAAGRCVVWSGGVSGVGHTGFLKTWSSASNSGTFTDANRDLHESILTESKTLSQLESMIRDATLEGYIGPA